MIAALPLDVPAIYAPKLHEVKRKRRSGRQSLEQSRGWTRPALVVGAVIVFSDGSACQIVQVEPTPLCVPVQPPTR